MRTNLVAGLMKNLIYNVRHGAKRVSLFEVGSIYYMEKEKRVEPRMVTGILYGDAHLTNWSVKPRVADFYDLKGSVENLITRLGIKKFSFQKGARKEYLHPQKSTLIMVGNKAIGYVGEMHPSLVEQYELLKAPQLFEIKINLLEKLFCPTPSYKPISKFPSIQRDISMLLNRDTAAQEIINVVYQSNAKHIKDVQIFYVFTGKGIEKDKKSVAVAIKYQSSQRTLTDEEVNKLHEKVRKTVINQLKATLR
jgi:phenylalanyl-tRNA synthetase beta chain